MSEQRLIAIVVLLSMLGPFSIDAYLPSFPDIEQALHTDRTAMSHSLGLYLLAFAISALLWGPIADSIGRRKTILLGLGCYLLGSVLAVLASHVDVLLLGRVFQGSGAAAAFVAGRALLRDGRAPETAHRALSQVMFWFTLAPALAPVLGGWLDHTFGWRSVFGFLLLYAVVLLLLSWRLPETLPHVHRQSLHWRDVVRRYREALMHGAFRNTVLTATMVFSALFLYIAGAPTLLHDLLGLSALDFGAQFIPMVIGLMVGSSLSSRLSSRWTPEQAVKAGLALMLLAVAGQGLLLQLVPFALWLLVGALMLFAAGLGMAMPALSLLAMDSLPTQRGLATSLQGAVQMMGNAAVASVVVPLLAVYPAADAFWLVHAGFLAAGVFFWWRRHARLLK